MNDGEDLFLSCELDDMFEDSFDVPVSETLSFGGAEFGGGDHDDNGGRAGADGPMGLHRRVQSWHDAAADKAERESMVEEISRLLVARKKGPPSQKWFNQLPHKARRLEDHLYGLAPSLGAYSDRGTLKARLQRVAVSLTKHFLRIKQQRQLQQRQRGGQRAQNAPLLPNSVGEIFSPGSVPPEFPSLSVQTLTNTTNDLSLTAGAGLVPNGRAANNFGSTQQAPYGFPGILPQQSSSGTYLGQSATDPYRQLPGPALLASQSHPNLDPEALRARLLAQQQHILNKIKQQELLIRRMQSSLLPQVMNPHVSHGTPSGATTGMPDGAANRLPLPGTMSNGDAAVKNFMSSSGVAGAMINSAGAFDFSRSLGISLEQLRNLSQPYQELAVLPTTQQQPMISENHTAHNLIDGSLITSQQRHLEAQQQMASGYPYHDGSTMIKDYSQHIQTASTFPTVNGAAQPVSTETNNDDRQNSDIQSKHEL